MGYLRGVKSQGYKKGYLRVGIKRKVMELYTTLNYLLCYSEHVLL